MIPLTFEQWVAVGSLVIAAITLLTSRRKDSNADAAFKAQMSAKLDFTNSSIVDVKSEIKAFQQQQTGLNSSMSERIAKCESLATSAVDKANNLEKMFHEVHPLGK